MRVLGVLAGLAVLMLCTGCTQSTAAKTCRADAQRFADENASFEAEYDTQFGATTVGQLSINDFLDRDKELMDCIQTDPHNQAQYRAVLYRNGFIEGNRFSKFMLDTQQLQDFAAWERGQQATQLANYRIEENQ
jgi:hypothetical protein